MLRYLHIRTDDVEWPCPLGLEASIRALDGLTRFRPSTTNLYGSSSRDQVKLGVLGPPFVRTNGTAFRGRFVQETSGWVLRGRFAASVFQRIAGLGFLALASLSVLICSVQLLTQWDSLTRAGAPLALAVVALLYLLAMVAFGGFIRWQLKPAQADIDTLQRAIGQTVAAPASTAA